MKVIKISCDASGDFTFTPAVHHAKIGDTIEFSCDDGDFTVIFPQTIAGVVQLHGSKGKNTPAVLIPDEKAGQRVLPGFYKYMVGVHRDDKVFMDIGCPVVVIDR